MMVGQTLGHYRIVREIGAGGMGVVYQAEDTTLERQVALKILPPELAADDQRRLRFAREARAVAALNHPNIVTVHSVEESGGIHFITMELVKGKTLAALLPGQGFALDRFFEIAIPMADAVAAAHQQGITHRDLKPANVMMGDDGRIKVLDFGLAKAMVGGGSRAGELPTQAATRAGLTVGTPAYMSPEQAQGEHVDPRSDIFSLGIIFYEMLRAGGRSMAATRPRCLRDSAGHATSGHRAAARGPARAREARRSLPREEPCQSVSIGTGPPPQLGGGQAGRRFGRCVSGPSSGTSRGRAPDRAAVCHARDRGRPRGRGRRRLVRVRA